MAHVPSPLPRERFGRSDPRAGDLRRRAAAKAAARFVIRTREKPRAECVLVLVSVVNRAFLTATMSSVAHAKLMRERFRPTYESRRILPFPPSLRSLAAPLMRPEQTRAAACLCLIGAADDGGVNRFRRAPCAPLLFHMTRCRLRCLLGTADHISLLFGDDLWAAPAR
jgi:hypothetical protein